MGGGGQGRTCIRQMDIVGFFKTKQKSRIPFFFHATPSGTLKQSLTDTIQRIPEATRMIALGSTINYAFCPLSIAESPTTSNNSHSTHPHSAYPPTANTTHLYTTTTHPVTTTLPVVDTCVDNLGQGLTCQQLPSICSDPYAQVVCRRSCKFCGEWLYTRKRDAGAL